MEDELPTDKNPFEGDPDSIEEVEIAIDSLGDSKMWHFRRRERLPDFEGWDQEEKQPLKVAEFLYTFDEWVEPLRVFVPILESVYETLVKEGRLEEVVGAMADKQAQEMATQRWANDAIDEELGREPDRYSEY